MVKNSLFWFGCHWPHWKWHLVNEAFRSTVLWLVHIQGDGYGYGVLTRRKLLTLYLGYSCIMQKFTLQKNGDRSLTLNGNSTPSVERGSMYVNEPLIIEVSWIPFDVDHFIFFHDKMSSDTWAAWQSGFSCVCSLIALRKVTSSALAKIFSWYEQYMISYILELYKVGKVFFQWFGTPTVPKDIQFWVIQK